MQTYLKLLRGEMGWLWTSRTLSDIGDSIHLLAFNWLLVQETRSAVAVATTSGLWLVGQVIAGWPGGRLADRWPPVRVLQGAYLVHGLVIAVFAASVLTHQVSVWTFYGLSFVLGLLGTPVDPASRALLVNLYPDRERLAGANGLFSTGTAVAQTCGPVLGGLVFYNFPLGWAFGLNALSYVLAALGLGAIQTPTKPISDQTKPTPPKSWGDQARLCLNLWDVLIPTALFVWLVAPLLTALLPYHILTQQGSVLDLGLLQSGLWTGVGLGLGLGSWLVGRTPNCSSWALIGLGITALLAGSFALVSGWGAIASLGGVGLAAGTTYLLLNQVLLDRIDGRDIAGLTGLLGSLLGLGIGLSSFALGWAVQQGFYLSVLEVGASVSLMTTLSLWLLRRGL